MPDIDAVVFDIGLVLIGWDPEGFFDREIGTERRRQLFAQVDLYEMNERIDLGEDFRRTIYDKADQHPDWRDEIRLWHDKWIEMAQPAIEHSALLLRALRRKGIPVFALSNFGVGSFAIAQVAYPVLQEFDRLYVSGHLRAIKPGPQIYQALEDGCGVAPDKLLFADDRPENIAAAQARGWHTHLFEGPQGFADRLIAEGLLTGHEAQA